MAVARDRPEATGAGKRAKEVLRQRAPRAFSVASRAFHWQRGFRFARRMSRVHADVRGVVGTQVAAGPFEGMEYGGSAVRSALAPKLIGSYEAEIQFVLERVDKYELVVDIGAAEGYYAVGLARRLPNARVTAYEIEPAFRELCLANAVRNHVRGRIDLRGECTHEELNGLDLDGAFILCDVDGAEGELLDPRAVPGLLRADLLVELHDCFVPGLTELVTGQFAETHEVLVVESRARTASDHAVIAGLPQETKRLALEEFRPPQSWAWIRRRDQADDG